VQRVKGMAGSEFEPPLQRGSQGAAVQALQRALVQLGAGIAVDGDFGPVTDAAVRQFQARRGLLADGIVGPVTMASLAAATGGGVSTPPSPAPPRPSSAKGRVSSFIERYGPMARAVEQTHRIPALFVLGQAALESGWGDHAPRFNFFGVKASPAIPEADRQLLTTTEQHRDPDHRYPQILSITPLPNGGYQYVVRDWFRAYADAQAAFDDHARVIKLPRYAAAFAHADDPYAFAAEVVRGGYATGRAYLDRLTQVMRNIEATGWR